MQALQTITRRNIAIGSQETFAGVTEVDELRYGFSRKSEAMMAVGVVGVLLDTELADQDAFTLCDDDQEQPIKRQDMLDLQQAVRTRHGNFITPVKLDDTLLSSQESNLLYDVIRWGDRLGRRPDTLDYQDHLIGVLGAAVMLHGGLDKVRQLGYTYGTQLLQADASHLPAPVLPVEVVNHDIEPDPQMLDAKLVTILTASNP